MQKKKNFQKSTEKRTKQQTYVHEKLDGTEREGLIVAHFGATADVEDSDGKVYHAHLRRNAEPCITGDKVLWRLEKDNTGIVASVLPRASLLARPEKANKIKLIAANIDTMVIVTAPYPLFSERLIDRYIVAAELLQIKPIILFNKVDLLNDELLVEIQEYLSTYEEIGYTVLYSSVYNDYGLDQLRDVLMDKTSVLVGVSGVGKSSIIAKLTGVDDIKIGDVGQQAGKHTTTTTRLYHLPQGGNLIDSPGVREFTLWHLAPDEIIKGFVEMYSYMGECKFRNCQHNNEPGCALLEALEEEKISSDRWDSYQEILQDMAGKRT
jgi:ribosome biogenesis GTPase